MKNVNDKGLVLSVILFLIALFFVRASAESFEYKGVFPVKSVFLTYCDSCFLELPPDFLNAEIVLSVKTDEENIFIKSLRTSSRAIGWDLVKSKDGMFKAQPLENVGNMVFISCMDMQPRNVPKYLYSMSVKADKMQCAKRDSLEQEVRKRAARDSVRVDSIRAAADSIKRLRLDFANYQLRYYAYSKGFSDRMGVEWGTLISSGNLRGKIRLFDDWRMVATETNDTTFTTRSVEFSVDSSLALDWGSEEQTLKQAFVNNGVTTHDYEWRKYGLLVKVSRDGQRVRMDYVFRDKDNSVSVLQGSVIGLDGDTLRLTGEYTVNRNVDTGIPFLSSVPLLGNLFKTTQSIVDNRAFELYLLPKKGGKDEKVSDRRR